jgi:hypothetical protein
MAVGPRRNPYGATTFFGYDDTSAPMGQAPAPQAPWSFLDVAPPPEEFQQQLIQPIEPAQVQGAGPEVSGGDAPAAEDFPSEESINRRLKLAQAMMEQGAQGGEVKHPLQAIGYATQQIMGAYSANKAQKDLEAAEKRRRDSLKKALGSGGDLNALAENLMASDDPRLVDQGLEIKLKLATAERKAGKPGQIRNYNSGGEEITEQFNEETGRWEPLATAPRYKPDSGGGGPGGGGRRQQGGAMRLPTGEVVPAVFNPGDGLYYYQTAEGTKVVPAGARPVTDSTGGTLNAAQWRKLKSDRVEGENALKAMQSYAKQAGGLPQGYQRWANSLAARWKTFLGSQGLSQAEFDQMETGAKQQALLGMLRTTIVGPGVMTEYDAQRVIQAMGGNPSSAIQNPAVMASILSNLYDRKRAEVQVLQEEYERNAPTFGEEPRPLDAPESIAPPAKEGQRTAPPPTKERIPGKTTVVVNGVTYVWTGTGWKQKE